MFNILKNIICSFITLSFAFYSIANAQDVAASNALATSQTQAPPQNNWGVSYLNYMNGPTFAESNGSSVNHYFTVKYKFNSDWALGFTAQPNSNFGTGESASTMGDSYLRLNYPTLYKQENGVKITGDVNYYAPTSEASQTAKISGVVSPRINTSYESGNLSLSYLLIPKIFLNTQEVEGQRTFSHGHYLAAGYKLSSFITLDFAFYPVWTIKRNQPTAFNDLPIYPGMTFQFNKNVSLSPYVELLALKTEEKTSSIGAVFSYSLL